MDDCCLAQPQVGNAYVAALSSKQRLSRRTHTWKYENLAVSPEYIKARAHEFDPPAAINVAQVQSAGYTHTRLEVVRENNKQALLECTQLLVDRSERLCRSKLSLEARHMEPAPPDKQEATISRGTVQVENIRTSVGWAKLQVASTVFFTKWWLFGQTRRDVLFTKTGAGSGCRFSDASSLLRRRSNASCR